MEAEKLLINDVKSNKITFQTIEAGLIVAGKTSTSELVVENILPLDSTKITVSLSQ